MSDEPPRNESGDFDLMAIMEEFLSLENLAKFKYEPATFLHNSTSSQYLRVCARCGCQVNGQTAQDRHQTWHRNISASIWMMQSALLDLMVKVEMMTEQNEGDGR